MLPLPNLPTQDPGPHCVRRVITATAPQTSRSQRKEGLDFEQEQTERRIMSDQNPHISDFIRKYPKEIPERGFTTRSNTK